MSHSQSQAQLRDPAIKLFGRNIPFPDSNIPATLQSMDECTETTESKEAEPVGDEAEEEEKGPKKPEKLIPCPRCDSSETKFCYFNNYNVNQPRHFCRSCHRYWTAGGTIRNVPVGAGRRRNAKHCSSSSSSSSSPTSSSASLRSRQVSETTHDVSLSDSTEAAEPEPRPGPGPAGEQNSPPRWGYPWGGVPVVAVPTGAVQFVVPWGGYVAGEWGPRAAPARSGEEERCLWVPKTLRVDDPEEAAKSSIWSTLGIEADRDGGGLVRGGVFKPFKRRSSEAGDSGDTEEGRVLRSNPAALSRSHSFQEST